MKLYLDGIGLLGPGLDNWAAALPILRGQQALVAAPTLLPAVDKLPAAERRRVGPPVKLSMAIGLEAIRHAGADAAQLATVFSSTEADCDNSHAILETLASTERALSPTRFHNSVHNAASGYWGIATGSQRPSTSLCAFDASFGAGLIETATQALQSQTPCLLLAYDTAYPEPLQSLRPLPAAMGVALLLSPQASPASQAVLEISLVHEAADMLSDVALETLRQQIPAARSLPLLQLLAERRSAAVVLDFLEPVRIKVQVSFTNPEPATP